MAKPLVTKELVYAEADALAAAGEDPSIVVVQTRIGGGSYSTVKRFLDQWKAERVSSTPRAALPDTLVSQGTELLHRVWGTAQALAEQHVVQVRAEYERENQGLRAQLAEAEQIITRLETEAASQQERFSTAQEHQERLQSELEQTRAGLQVREAQLEELRQRLSEAQQVAEQRQAEVQEARTAVVQQARLEGEVAALRQQLSEQLGVIERLRSPAPRKPRS